MKLTIGKQTNELDGLRTRITNNPNLWYRYCQMKKKISYTNMSVNLFNSVIPGYYISVFKQPTRQVEVSIYELV